MGADPPAASRAHPAGSWADVPIARKGLVVIAIPIFALLSVTIGFYVISSSYHNAAGQVIRTQEVRTVVRDVRETLTHAESNARGYILTRNPEFRATHDEARAELPGRLDRLARLTGDDPTQLANIEELRPLVTERVALLDNTIAAADAGVTDPEQVNAILTAGRQSMTQVLTTLDRIDAEEARLLAERQDRQRMTDEQLRAMAIGGLLVGLLGGGTAAWLFTSGVAGRLRTLEANAGRLARGEALAEGASGADEIGRVGAAMRAAIELLAERDAEIRASEQRYRMLARNYPNGFVILYDRDLRILIADGQGLSAFGYARQDLEGRLLHEAVRPERIAVIEPHIRKALTGEPTGYETVASGRSYQLRLYPATDDLGAITGVLLVAEDITERRLAEAALEAARAEALQASAAKSEFLSRMSHELRTPLNAILGFAQVLEMDGVSPEQEESLAQIVSGGEHLLELINEVLDLTRIEAGRLRLSLEPVNVRSSILEAVALIQPLATSRNVMVVVGDVTPSLFVQADRQRLKQVLLNLLSNAVKYNRESGTITIGLAVTEATASISITDTGRGISADDLAHLYEPFDRLGAEGSAVEGTGLGLALAKRLTEAMEGAIGARSVVGEGSTFTIELPVAGAPVLLGETPVAEEELAAPISHDGVVALYIEDNLSNLRLVEHVLARRSIQLISAQQGRLGFDLALQHLPDLILLDLHLPDTNGREVLEQLRADPRTRDIPVVILSADATPGQIERLRAAGADDYLTKPLDVRRFIELLDELLGRSSRASRD